MDFFIYAPKNDPFLREKWREPWPESQLQALKSLSAAFKAKGIRFGIGLTPFKVKTLSQEVQRDLKAKVSLINEVQPALLSILFDDFDNDVSDLAATQVEIAEFIAAESNATDFQVVGTYYADDPLLSRVYGAMPRGYLENLGALLDQRFDIFWTGDHVISLGYDEQALVMIADKLQRKPFLWDNYPVNDTQWLKHRLRLYSFTGRPWQLANWCSGHAVNPMIQPQLSKIPLATLADIYTQKNQFVANESFKSALQFCCGEALAQAIQDNLVCLTEEGVNSFSSYTRKRLKTLFQSFDSPQDKPYADEILQWLEAAGE